MKQTLYIHCGVQKTGSTLIQDSIQRLSSDLQEQGIRVVPRQAVQDSTFFDYHCRFRDRRPVDYNHWKTLAETWLKSVLRSHQPERIVVSHEYLLGSAYRGFFFRAGEAARHLVDGFGALGWDVRLILYTKRQDRLIESMFRQRFKRDDPPTLDGFLQAIPWRSMDWLALIRSLCRSIPRDHLIIRPAELIRRGDAAFVSDFLRACNIRHKEPIRVGPETNRSLPARQILDRHPTLAQERQHWIARQTGKDAQDTSEEDTLVPGLFLRKVLKSHRASNQKLCSSLLAKFPEADYAPDCRGL
jgi:hypothetical protein